MSLVALPDPPVASRRASRRVSWRSLLAATGETSLALTCGYAAYELLATADAEESAFDVEMLLVFEAVGVLVQRWLWLGAEMSRFGDPEKAGCRSAATTLGGLLVGSVALIFYLPMLGIVLVLMLASEPRHGLVAAFVLGRKLAWAWVQRPRSADEHEQLRGYWKLTRRVHAGAVFGAWLVALLVAEVVGGPDADTWGRVAYLAGSGVYFAVLAVYLALDDPRLDARAGFRRPAEPVPPEALLTPIDWRGTARLLAAGAVWFVPGVALLTFVFEGLAPATPLGRDPVGWLPFLGIGGWLVIGGASRALSLTDGPLLGHSVARAGGVCFAFVAAWMMGLGLLLAAGFVAVAAAGGAAPPDDALRPSDIAVLAGTTCVSLYGLARTWPAFVNPFVYPPRSAAGRSRWASFPEAWRMTRSPRALAVGSGPVLVAVAVTCAPAAAWVWAELPSLVARLWLYGIAVPAIALVAVERAVVLRVALEATEADAPADASRHEAPRREASAAPGDDRGASGGSVVPVPPRAPGRLDPAARRGAVRASAAATRSASRGRGYRRHPSREADPPRVIHDGPYDVPVDLDLAIRMDDVNLLLALADRGADVAAFRKHPGSALHRAVWCSSPGVTEALLDMKGLFTVDDLDDRGRTPLQVACETHGNQTLRCVDLLVARGADVSAVAPNGGSPLSAAAWNGNAALVRALIAAGADPAGVDGDHAPLRKAIARGSQEVVDVLGELGGAPELSPQELADRLHEEIQRANDKGVDVLLALGADPRLPYDRVPTIDAIGLAEWWDQERPGRWHDMIAKLRAAAAQLDRKGRSR